MNHSTAQTEHLSHLHDRPLAQANGHSQNCKQQKGKGPMRRERTFATDFFMLFVYSLLGIALASQLCLIVLLDIL